MRLVIKGQLCEWPGCKQAAENPVGNGGEHSTEITLLCHDHSQAVTMRHDPEYIVSCPNCHCRFGVN